MQHHITPGVLAAAAACALLLAGCGGDSGGQLDGGGAQIPDVSRIDLLASDARGMESVVLKDGAAFVSLSNSATQGTAVIKAALPLSSASNWTPVALGGCALGPVGDFIVRAPKLRMAGDTLWLIQPWTEGPDPAVQEHSACTMAAQAASFAPRDAGLRACNEYFCSTLDMSDIKLSGTRLYSNAGAGLNLFGSSDGGATWRVLRGQFDAMMCTHTSFQVVGERVLVGGECPLDFAFLEAYQLSADGLSLASQDKLALTVPALQNRNIQFIEQVGGAQRVFVGVEGGLLRSEDGGKSFKFVIHHPVEGGRIYPYVKSILALKGRPDTLVVSGFDKKNAKPYLAVSRDGGTSWQELSSMLPGYSQPPGGDTKAAIPTSLAEDAQGRVLITLNEREDGQGRLLQLTLGRR
ncbi:hypothetical protein [Massilia sp. ST3]|uniref:WD40/YVTN/BNR-like repeat-containing protein n=1 Tax=Massilia sp. ST3 TaxID=2824903 RepID=UPI001B831C2D|nr:hypothetical protein [Massilia sp. ST3]MBQ5946809.1 hypothetical protein [Massilia sp. ST3]